MGNSNKKSTPTILEKLFLENQYLEYVLSGDDDRQLGVLGTKVQTKPRAVAPYFVQERNLVLKLNLPGEFPQIFDFCLKRLYYATPAEPEALELSGTNYTSYFCFRITEVDGQFVGEGHLSSRTFSSNRTSFKARLTLKHKR